MEVLRTTNLFTVKAYLFDMLLENGIENFRNILSNSVIWTFMNGWKKTRAALKRMLNSFSDWMNFHTGLKAESYAQLQVYMLSSWHNCNLLCNVCLYAQCREFWLVYELGSPFNFIHPSGGIRHGHRVPWRTDTRVSKANSYVHIPRVDTSVSDNMWKLISSCLEANICQYVTPVK